MKLTSIEIHPEGSSDYAILSFRDPGSKNPYSVKGITGLDANAIVPKFYKGPGTTKFQNMSLESRDIVFQIELNPDFALFKSYSDLRDDLYRMIASSRTGQIQIQFKNRADIVAAISGHISKFESDLFQKQQIVQLTVTCDEPMLRAPTPVVLFQDIVISPTDDISIIVRELS